MATFEELAQQDGAIVEDLQAPIEYDKPESTMGDYANIVNPFSIQWQNPELMYKTSMNQGGVDINNPEFEQLYKDADGATKKALGDSTSLEHAYAIVGRRNEFAEASKAIENDPFLVQLGMGLLPAMASPTTLIPFGAVGNVAKLGNAVAKLGNVGSKVAIGAATGATANMIDEVGFQAQGVQYDYLAAGVIGMGFGGLIGGISGALAGPYAKSHAQALSKEGDTFTQHFDKDPELKIEVDENGIPRVAAMDKSLIDRVPWLGKVLRSDVHTVYQDTSEVLRGYMTKFANATVSRKDMDGNIVPVNKTAQNYKAEIQGIHNTTRMKVLDAYTLAKESGEFKGSYDDYIKEVSDAYTKAGAKQEVEVGKLLYPKVDELSAAAKAEKDKKLLEFESEEVPKVIDETTGKERDLTVEELAVIEKDRETSDAYMAAKEEVDTWNQSLFDDVQTEMGKLREAGTLSKAEINKLEAELLLKAKDAMDELPIEPIREGPEVTLKKRTHRERARFKEDIEAEYKQKLEDDIRALKDELYAANPVKFEGKGAIAKGADEFKSYHEQVREKGIEAKLEELKNTSKDKLYRARTWNFEGIKGMDPGYVKDRLRAALSNHPAQRDYTAEMIDVAVDNIYNSFKEKGFEIDSLTTTFTIPKDLPFESMLKYRKWKVDESKLGDLLKDNLEDVTGAYNYKMSGRIAVMKATDGVEWQDFKALLRDKLIAEGKYSEEALQAFQRVVEDTAGTLRMNTLSNTPQWTWTRNMMSANSARLGGGFGGNQFIELAANIMMNGMGALVNGRFKTTWEQSGRMLYKGRAANDEFTQAMVNSGFLDASLHTSRINRQSDVDMGLNPGMYEKKLNWLQDTLMKVNGMRYFTAVMEDYTGGAIMTQIQKLAKKNSLTTTETKRIARWGLTHDDVKALSGELDINYKPSEGKFDLEAFAPENRDKFQMAIQNGVQEMVIQGDSIHTPNWMKTPGPMLKLLTQFMRFPLIAQEQLLRRGMAEEQARFVGGLIASTATFMALKYTREQASIAAGFTDEIDAKYDYFGRDNEDAMRRGVYGSLNYNANLGMLSSVWNYAAIATGNPELGRDYAFDKGVSALVGPTGALADDAIKLFTSAANGEFGTDKDQMILKGLGPMLSLPILSEGINSYIKE